MSKTDTSKPGLLPMLIKFDRGFVARIEAERDSATGGTGHKLPRTAMIRILLKEALDARARARGELPLLAEIAELNATDSIPGDLPGTTFEVPPVSLTDELPDLATVHTTDDLSVGELLSGVTSSPSEEN